MYLYVCTSCAYTYIVCVWVYKYVCVHKSAHTWSSLVYNTLRDYMAGGNVMMCTVWVNSHFESWEFTCVCERPWHAQTKTPTRIQRHVGAHNIVHVWMYIQITCAHMATINSNYLYIIWINWINSRKYACTCTYPSTWLLRQHACRTQHNHEHVTEENAQTYLYRSVCA